MKITIPTLLLVLLFNLSGFAQANIGLNWGGTKAKDYYEEIPYESVNGKLFITVSFQHRKAKFLFDTGAPTQISPDLAEELNCNIIDKVNVTDANGSSDTIKIALLKEIGLNQVVFNDLHVLLTNPDMYKCWGAEGVVGSNMLHTSILHIDAAKHLLILTDDLDKLHLRKENAVSMISNKGPQSQPYLALKFNGKEVPLIGFDTGDSDFFIISKPYMSYLAQKNDFQKMATGYGSVGHSLFGLQKQDTTYRIKIPAIQLGNHTFTNVITESNNKSSTRLGSKILDYGNVTLDFKHHKFYFEADSTVLNLDEKRWPVALTAVDNKVAVVLVWDKPNVKLQPGEEVTAIDDTPYESFSFCQLLNSKPLLFGKEKALLTVKNAQGVVRKVTIIKE